MSIIINNISKQFGTFKALDNVSLEIPDNHLVALLGPSGSGKSTLLRAIAGLESPDSGYITIDNQDVTHLDVRQRNIGFVFQHYALFKHLTVRQNIAFGLEIRKFPTAQIKSRVAELMALIQLEGLGDRYPHQLSGGQRQRVALARALAVQPQVLLLDEPFGALDAKVRKELRSWLRRLHNEVRVTSVFVTHDQEEAMDVADIIVVMNQGRIEQMGTSEVIYDHPSSPFVMSFVGEVNVLSSTSKLFGDRPFSSHSSQVFVRPHELEIHRDRTEKSTPATIQRIARLGWEIQVELLLSDNQIIVAQLSRDRGQQLNLTPGQTVFVQPRHAIAFDNPHAIVTPLSV